MFLPAPAMQTNKARVVAGPWAATSAGGTGAGRTGALLGAVTGRHRAALPGGMQMLLPSLTPLRTSRCQHVPPPRASRGMCRIKPLILLPFNPPCAAAAPTSSCSPPYLIKVSAAAPQECRPGYCIPRSTRQPLHPAPAPLTRPRSPSQVPARRKTSRAASPAAKPPREEPERRRRVGGEAGDGATRGPGGTGRFLRSDWGGRGCPRALPRPASRRQSQPGRQRLRQGHPAGPAGLGVVRGKTVISVIPDGGTAQRRVGSGTAGSGQSDRPSASRMRAWGTLARLGYGGDITEGFGWGEESRNWSISAGMCWLLWQLPAWEGARRGKGHLPHSVPKSHARRVTGASTLPTHTR